MYHSTPKLFDCGARSVRPIVMDLQHLTKRIKCWKGNNSHNDSLKFFDQNETDNCQVTKNIFRITFDKLSITVSELLR